MNEDRLDPELADRLEGFLRDYYRDDLGDLAQRYPEDQRWLTVEWRDLYRFDQDVADDHRQFPERIEDHLAAAAEQYDYPVPVDIDLDVLDVRVVGLGSEDVYSPLEIVREDPDGYVGVTGELAKVTTPAKLLEEAAWTCQRCGLLTHVPQTPGGMDEPHECQHCERNGPFVFDADESVFEHYCKIRIETPPDQTGELQEEYLDGFVRGDLVWTGHDEYGLVARSGEQVTAYGTIDPRSKGGSGESERLFDPYLELSAIEFEGDQEEIDVEAFREEFEALAEREDAVDVFAESIAPELYATPEWDAALELLVAYLFGAPRIDIPGGPTIRGDIHALIISDYGMGKSMVNSSVALFSPKCIKESVTGMSSDVALLAAAVEDDFGDGQWTLQPGILVRANGGHVILDEIDKTDVNLERMNNALEGEQIVDINKAGQSATYKSRVGLLATGNPENSRFDPTIAISEQLDLDQSLLSRFDGIVTMEDRPDEEQDAMVAETQGMSYIEAYEYQHGDREELDRLERVVEPDVGRNWVAAAREECHPMPGPEHVEEIRDWYAEEVRQLNESFSDASDGETGDMPVPVSARVVMATIRFAVAFARVHLREEVADEDVERAMELSKKLVGQNFDGEKFVPQESRRSQHGEVRAMANVLQNASEPLSIERIAERAGVSEQKTKHRVKEFKKRGDVTEPEVGEYRWID